MLSYKTIVSDAEEVEKKEPLKELRSNSMFCFNESGQGLCLTRYFSKDSSALPCLVASAKSTEPNPYFKRLWKKEKEQVC